MGRHQQAETSGVISFLICALVGGCGSFAYTKLAPAIWQVTQRLFMVSAGIIAVCGTLSFITGYIQGFVLTRRRQIWYLKTRRAFEAVALSVVYASTIFLLCFMVFGIINNVMGHSFISYLTPLSAAFSGLAGYIAVVQAQLMNAKTIASLLPVFIISGVATAGLLTDDPNWFKNNFSQLGDRTTFASRMFNSTLILGGICIIIISYFSISELVTIYRQRLEWRQTRNSNQADRSVFINLLKLRMGVVACLLIFCGIDFIGIGTFRYTPHPVLHNTFAKSLPLTMGLLLIGLPWLVPRLPRTIYIISDLALLVCVLEWMFWLNGSDSMTNVEALGVSFFLGWFIVFSRQIAAMEADRIQELLIREQSSLLDAAQSNPKRSIKETVAIPQGRNEVIPSH